MFKLSDIIKSGGGNAKINRFINRYVLSKKEKKDIINGIKESEGSSSEIKYKYYSIPITDAGYIVGMCITVVPTLVRYNGSFAMGSYIKEWVLNSDWFSTAINVINLKIKVLDIEYAIYNNNEYWETYYIKGTFKQLVKQMMNYDVVEITEEEYWSNENITN